MDFISEITRHIKIYGIDGWSDLIEDRSLVYHQISGLWFYVSIGKGSLFQFISLFYSETIEKRLRVFQTESNRADLNSIRVNHVDPHFNFLIIFVFNKKKTQFEKFCYVSTMTKSNLIEFGSKFKTKSKLIIQVSIVSLYDG